MNYTLCHRWINEVAGTRCERVEGHDGGCFAVLPTPKLVEVGNDGEPVYVGKLVISVSDDQHPNPE